MKKRKPYLFPCAAITGEMLLIFVLTFAFGMCWNDMGWIKFIPATFLAVAVFGMLYLTWQDIKYYFKESDSKDSEKA